ncbi:hypothetical protein KIPB_002571 [Kipferlia bialata]|uniref:Uncharacterized protein n=1 Tax=Kipferlia bialata TaxID=797122 RepID=A0A391NJI1_9EUKA|nr:hypothetical protein KIPB_002571 [Kipferlia bialata]|eukprot:g2571.t1
MDAPESCTLAGEFVLFTHSYSLYEPYRDPVVTMYNPDTKRWTLDSRKGLSLPSDIAYTVESHVLHVFGDGRHITYTIKRGFREDEKIPSSVGTIHQAQSFDRLILLFCESGLHLYDCISGDYVRLGETSSRLNWVSAGDQCVLVEARETLLPFEEHDTAAVVTLNLDISALSQEGREDGERRVVVQRVRLADRAVSNTYDWEKRKILRECMCGLMLEVQRVGSVHKPTFDLYDLATEEYSGGSRRCTRIIGDEGSIVTVAERDALEWFRIQEPASCTLDGEFVLFTLRDGTPVVTMYNPDTEQWTLDRREGIHVRYRIAHTVENDVLHVFGDGRHLTYTIKRGFREEEKIPSSVGTIHQAQSFDRLILLLGSAGTHLYDCISGDYTKVADKNSEVW